MKCDGEVVLPAPKTLLPRVQLTRFGVDGAGVYCNLGAGKRTLRLLESDMDALPAGHVLQTGYPAFR